MLVGIGKDP